MTEEEYIKTGDEKVQAANEKYEGQEKSNIEKDALRVENAKTVSDVAYEKVRAITNGANLNHLRRAKCRTVSSVLSL